MDSHKGQNKWRLYHIDTLSIANLHSSCSTNPITNLGFNVFCFIFGHVVLLCLHSAFINEPKMCICPTTVKLWAEKGNKVIQHVHQQLHTASSSLSYKSICEARPGLGDRGCQNTNNIRPFQGQLPAPGTAWRSSETEGWSFQTTS